MHVQLKEQNNHPEITVMDTQELYGEKGNFRVLQFSNEAIQGALDLDQPKRILFEYPRAIIHLVEWNDPTFEDIFIIGHGIGTLPGYFSDKRCKVAELSAPIVHLSRQYFGYNQDNIIIGDGRAILESEQNEGLDYIVVDAFTDKGTPHHLVSWEFFRTASEKLDEQGSIILNLIGRSENDSFIHAIHTTACDIFPYVRSFSLPVQDSTDTQNILIMASKSPIMFQSKHLAGFTEVQFSEGYIIWD
ncbi:spermidine synthase [Paenibacillus sp. EC2-1]|uniref:spermidine synthase n=1 Tax=Paenibacillus sp. EC2-1 TaxID=3388665 RepID=UPI003BEEE0CC